MPGAAQWPVALYLFTLTIPPAALSVSPQSGPTCERRRDNSTFESGKGNAGLSALP